MKRFTLVLLVALIALSALISCPALPSPPPLPPPAPVPERTPAEFEMSSLVIKPAEVTAGEPVSVTALVKNIGGSWGTYVARLSMDGEVVETKEVTLPSGLSEIVTFTVMKDAAVTYDVTLNELKGTLTVISPPLVLSFADTGQKLGEISSFEFVLAQDARIECGDIDGDGDSDCVLAASEGASTIQVYQNDGTGILTNTGQQLLVRADPHPPNNFGVRLADVNNDGHLDLISADAWRGTNVYINDGRGNFSVRHQILYSHLIREVKGIDAGDIDDDGDLDLVVGGHLSEPDRVYINDGTGTFIDSGQHLGSTSTWDVVIVDLDSDGDLDYVAGSRYGDPTTIYLNDGGGHFKDSGQRLGAHDTDDIKLADVDGDGDLDLIEANSINGNSINEQDEMMSKVYINNGKGIFADSGQNLGVVNCETKEIGVGDVDNDGDLDLMLGNWNQANYIYLNDGTGKFTMSEWTIPSLKTHALSLIDLNNDGYLDVITGSYAFQGYRVYRVYLGNVSGSKPNKAPQHPTKLDSKVTAQTITLTWNNGSDLETPKTLLTYNLRIGTSPGGNEVFSGSTHFGFGNVGHSFSKTMTGLGPGKYYWSVQTVDSGLKKSPWAVERSFVI